MMTTQVPKNNLRARINNTILGLFCLFTGAIDIYFFWLAMRENFTVTKHTITASIFAVITVMLFIFGRLFFVDRYQLKKATLAVATMGLVMGVIGCAPLLWLLILFILFSIIYLPLFFSCFTKMNSPICKFFYNDNTNWWYDFIAAIPSFIQQWRFFFATTYFLLGGYFIYRFYQRQIVALKDSDLLLIERVSISLSLIFSVVLLLAVFLLIGELSRWLPTINF